jgi:hypothetical protein
MNSVFVRRTSGNLMGILLLGFALAIFAVPAAQAQPFGTWLQLAGNPNHGYVAIPHSPALNPTSAFTFEAWVNVRDANSCSSIAGKNWKKAWWIGICSNNMRSYVKGYAPAGVGGTGTLFDAGKIPLGFWTHVAVVYDGSKRQHYINGELAGTKVESGPLTTDTDEVRIGSDTAFPETPQGGIDEVHLWNVARTQAQIRADMAAPITSAQPGLVAVWHLDVNGNDAIGGHNGLAVGSGVTVGVFPALASCAAFADVNHLCLQDRFLVSTAWRTGAPGDVPGGNGVVAVNSSNSGIFWFFSSDNWEVMTKVLNACALNSHYWVFSAATTNVFYRMDVLDVRAGVQKIYFNYPGPPAPAVTDVNAFATCP